MEGACWYAQYFTRDVTRQQVLKTLYNTLICTCAQVQAYTHTYVHTLCMQNPQHRNTAIHTPLHYPMHALIQHKQRNLREMEHVHKFKSQPAKLCNRTQTRLHISPVEKCLHSYTLMLECNTYPRAHLHSST